MMHTHENEKQRLEKLFAESAAVLAAIRESVREALLKHKRLGNPVARWQDGRVIWIPADQISVDDSIHPQ